jgi:phage/plasmid-like protein (TIGR03299 family)
MSHEIDTSNNRANIAYRGETPWHGLGSPIEPGDDAETIKRKAGVNFEILKADVMYRDESGKLLDAGALNRSVLYRSDTKAPLSIMSTENYQIHQPEEIFDFIAQSARAMGWEIETAGSLRGGRKVWALAKLGVEHNLGTKANPDVVRGNLLAATSCDGSIASEFLFTSVRVVCANTLHAALNDGDKKGRVKVYHFNSLDVAQVKKALNIAPTVWAQFIENAKRLAATKVSKKQAVSILRNVYEVRKPAEKEVEGKRLTDAEFFEQSMSARHVLELFDGRGIGMQIPSAHGTAWGLVNAATEYYDHATPQKSQDARLNSAWFGVGASKKDAVLEACLELVK